MQYFNWVENERYISTQMKMHRHIYTHHISNTQKAHIDTGLYKREKV